MILLIIRHGQTLFNKLQYTQGWFDSPLTDLGIRQAKKAAINIVNEHIDYAYSSYSERAYDTVEYALGDRKLPIVRDKRFKEMNFGVYEGNNDIFYHEVLISSRGALNHDASEYGGESKEEVINREYEFLEELNQKYPDATILLGGHGISIKLIVNYIAEKSLREYDPDYGMAGNGDVIKIEYHGRNSKILKIYRNDVKE